jgi:hypothetical protein
MYQPQLLRAQVIDIYGFDQFKQNLANLIDEWQQEQYEFDRGSKRIFGNTKSLKYLSKST